VQYTDDTFQCLYPTAPQKRIQKPSAIGLFHKVVVYWRIWW